MRLFVSQLTREHLRKTVSFFMATETEGGHVPFHSSGTGTLNTLVLALLTFIAEIKKDVIFAMEEPEIALPPHTQRRIADYLLKRTSQCFVTSQSPYVIERFEPEQIMRLKMESDGVLIGAAIKFPPGVKKKTYHSYLRRAFAEAMLGRGVIVGEGPTERTVLTAAARKMEESDATIFPLDVAGVSIMDAGGDGNLGEMGAFFKALDLPAFCLLR